MGHSGDHRTQRLIGGLDALLHAARNQRTHVAPVAARRAAVADRVGVELQLSRREHQDLLVAALATDVGAALFDASAANGASLTAALLGSLGWSGAGEAVAARHERPDGQGLPRGLAEHEIPLAARILAIADLLVRDGGGDAIDWDRRLEAMKDGAGAAFDLGLTDLCFELLRSDSAREAIEAATPPTIFSRLSDISGNQTQLGSMASLLRAIEDVTDLAELAVATITGEGGIDHVGVHRIVGSECEPVACRGSTPEVIADRIVPLPVRTRDGGPCSPFSVVALGSEHVVVAPIGTTRPWGFVWAVLESRVQAEAAARLVTEVADVLLDQVERTSQTDRLEALAHRDHLTGLANRWRLEEELDDLFGADPEATADVALIMCDVDGLKMVNDTRGHAAGDDVLRAVAASLERVADPYDALITRLGGDEFCVLLRSGALLHAANLARAVAADVRSSAPSGVDLSCGIAYAAHCESATALLSAADQAQYAVKRRRPGRAAQLAPVPDRRSRRRA